MRKAMLTILLAVVSNGAAAAWVPLSTSTGDRGFDMYVDPATIRRTGNMVEISEMYDFKEMREVNGIQFFSEKFQKEYDCEHERYRTLFFSVQSGQMGNGDLLYSSSAGSDRWTPVIPSSAASIGWEFACGNR